MQENGKTVLYLKYHELEASRRKELIEILNEMGVSPVNFNKILNKNSELLAREDYNRMKAFSDFLQVDIEDLCQPGQVVAASSSIAGS